MIMIAYKMTYHVPVMLKECVDGLNIDPEGVYIDLTFGGGGHAREILKYLTTGHLYAFDQDADARVNAEEFSGDSRFTFIASNFRYFNKYLKMYNVTQVDGILADLGVSSHQIDAPERGFSTRFDSDIDMRMDQTIQSSAKNILNEYSESKLQDVLGRYGEVKNAKTLARAIVNGREVSEINTVNDLKSIAEPLAPRKRENKYLAQVFQALRIEVNKEMEALEEMLYATEKILKPGGRLVIMSYHSLEDRPVKYWINTGNLSGKQEKDFYGNLIRPFEPVTRKPVTADKEELQINPRSRSAKLRIGKRNG